MKAFNNQEKQESKTTETVPIFSYELMRDVLIPEILGKDTAEITYWAGKNLARKFPLLSMEELYSFFNEAGWGSLQLIQEDKHEYKFELQGSFVERRLQMQQNPVFSLEAGFLAEQIQVQKRFTTEAHDELFHKKKKVVITVRWDKKDPVE